MWLLRPPGVYVPQGDTRLLLEALRGTTVPRDARMLDVCTGTGVVALAGARMGAAEVHAVDLSARAAMAARLNARMRGLRVTVHRGDFLDHPSGRFDLVTANPPYVPSPVPRRHRGPGRGPVTGRTAGGERAGGSGGSRACDGGDDGREHLDRLCLRAPQLLAEGGTLLVVHSDMCGTERTLALLREAGLKAAVTARGRQPFGPLLRARAGWLERRGLIAPGEREEELVVVRADAPASGRASGSASAPAPGR
ncbi:methyltransferase [Streptomyces marispadix]|uniref:Methyltransferase n=1 Tax=Streptomyces marispadix TaxID=2922868 RepID=A0ABS9T3L3_9ACTN|nr:methyltransferase [Streptomyces marispadix]MCH6163111.1 methyltransferase [Streptomyces marispadix]